MDKEFVTEVLLTIATDSGVAQVYSDAAQQAAEIIQTHDALVEALEWMLNSPNEERGSHTAITYAQEVLGKVTGKLEWKALWDAMDAHPESWIETTEKMYWAMLESVPPRAQANYGFLVGEALRDTAAGPIYACFRNRGDNRYFAKHLTLEQFRQL